MGAQRRDSRPNVACVEELLSKIRNGTSLGIGNEEIKGNFVSLFGGVVEWWSGCQTREGRECRCTFQKIDSTLKARRVASRGREQG